MGRRLVTFAVAAALLASPAAAQQQPTPQENLDCAVWSVTVASRLEKGSPVKASLNAMFAWFIGLYEGQTGGNSDEALKARISSLTAAEFQSLNTSCAARMTAFGERLKAVGSAMKQSGS
jgi:hypothetical protein